MGVMVKQSPEDRRVPSSPPRTATANAQAATQARNTNTSECYTSIAPRSSIGPLTEQNTGTTTGTMMRTTDLWTSGGRDWARGGGGWDYEWRGGGWEDARGSGN